MKVIESIMLKKCTQKRYIKSMVYNLLNIAQTFYNLSELFPFNGHDWKKQLFIY